MTACRTRILPLLVATAALWPRAADPCAFVADGTVRVRIDAEEALIVWDAAQQTEHFIRRANFAQARGSFGFVVPTPTRPALAEADDGVFARLARLYLRPPSRRARRARGAVGAEDGGGSVEVVEVRRVAGLDATVLRATDPEALRRWLRSHGFVDRPGFAAWLARYTTGTWHLTAFRYDAGTRGTVGSRAVRLSFRTDRPFYPYAEPSDQNSPPQRRLRLTVVAPARMEGRLGGAAWGARTGFAAPQPMRALLRGAVADSALPASAWMTTFDDHPSRRGRDDLYFVPAAEQQPVAPSLARDEVVTVRRNPNAGLGRLFPTQVDPE